MFGYQRLYGLILGVIFLLVVNRIAEKVEGKRDGKKLNMLMFSVTLHNIPEGMSQSRVCENAWDNLIQKH